MTANETIRSLLHRNSVQQLFREVVRGPPGGRVQSSRRGQNALVTKIVVYADERDKNQDKIRRWLHRLARPRGCRQHHGFIGRAMCVCTCLVPCGTLVDAVSTPRSPSMQCFEASSTSNRAADADIKFGLRRFSRIELIINKAQLLSFSEKRVDQGINFFYLTYRHQI